MRNPFPEIPKKSPLLETVSVYKKKPSEKRGEAVGWAACREAACQRTNGALPKDLDLPARSRSGEGRAVTLVVRIQTCKGYEHIQFYTSGDFS